MATKNFKDYTLKYLPKRYPQIESRMTLLEFYDGVKNNWPYVATRANQVAFISTVWHIVKELEPYPTAHFNLNPFPIDKVNKYGVCLQISSDDYREDVAMRLTPDNFELLSPTQKLAPFKTLLHWICCMRLKSPSTEFMCGSDLIDLAIKTRRSMMVDYQADPVRFMLVSQCARLLLP